MRKDNPAIYECHKSTNKLHSWKLNKHTKRATCKYCKLELNQEDTKDCYEEYDDELVIRHIEPHVPNWTEEEVEYFINGMVKTKYMTKDEIEKEFGVKIK